MVTFERIIEEPESVAKAPLAPVPLVVIVLSESVMVLAEAARTAALRPWKLLLSADEVSPLAFS